MHGVHTFNTNFPSVCYLLPFFPHSLLPPSPCLYLLLFRSGALASSCCKVGVILALMLHMGIAVTPPPNNVGAFSVIMCVRLVFFAPASSANVLGELILPRSAASVCRASFAVALASAATALAAYGAHFVSSEGRDVGADSTAEDGGVGQLGIMFFKGIYIYIYI